MKLSAIDKFTRSIAPRWTLNRLRARAATDMLVRHYEAAQPGRRTSGWTRNRGDANAVATVAIAELRIHARHLIRNNAWAKRGQRTIANNTVSWGIVPKPLGAEADKARQIFKAWAEATTCDADGHSTFYGLQHLALRSAASDGEFLLRRRWRYPAEGVPLNMQVQALEGDFLDTSKDGLIGAAGGPITQGVEFDKLGRRVAYWLFPEHPGGANSSGVSRRVPASEIIHVFYRERAGQVRGISWFGAAIVPLKDFDEYEDATLLRQKIAACFAAFVTDEDGVDEAVGEEDEEDDGIEHLEPGQVTYLPPGKSVTFGNPPSVTDDKFSARNLRRIAMGLGVTYEDLTGDYSQVNYSSARMARLSHWANVRDWQYNMLIPLLCQGAWQWAMEAAVIAGELSEVPGVEWTPPPMPMIEPDKEGTGYKRQVRAGLLTPSAMVREMGGDPATHWAEYAADLKELDRHGIVLDSDPRKTSDAGLTQERGGGGGGGGAGKAPKEAAAETAEE